MVGQTCETCTHWRNGDDGKYGSCEARYPMWTEIWPKNCAPRFRCYHSANATNCKCYKNGETATIKEAVQVRAKAETAIKQAKRKCANILKKAENKWEEANNNVAKAYADR